MFCVSLDESFDKGCFAHSWRTNDCDDGRRGFGGKAVDERDMESFFFDLLC